MDRSQNMRAIKDRDTRPEMIVRRATHAMGYRYRLHDRRLPGKPDMVFASRRCVIFVHGCFWHMHDCRPGGRIPKSRPEYWGPKLRRNRERDEKHQQCLKALGWRVLVVWECETKDRDRVAARVKAFLSKAVPST